jgi:hypothetical protein
LKKLLALVVLVGIVFIVVNRERLFIRDPLGSVLRDGAKESGAQVFINYSNDVLIENDNVPQYMTLVQHGQKVGTPTKIQCLHWMACLTDADVATMVATDAGSLIESMTNRAVMFKGSNRRQTVVKLR